MGHRAANSGEQSFSFDPFCLIPKQQILLEGGAPVRLGSRAIEVLTALVERPGEVVGKDELIARVWPNTIVEEGNLKVHIAALRRILGEGKPGRRYIATIPGHGYRFVAPVELSEPAKTVRRVECPHNLPAPSTPTVGRAETLKALRNRILQYRFVCVVGPGGMGKTKVALAVAETFIDAFKHGVWFADLAPLRDPQLTPSVLAATLGLKIRSDDIVESLKAHLHDKQLLLVLDNCEHIIESAASVAEQIFDSAPDVSILATSREPLRARGEHIYRLAPLKGPSNSSELTATQALTFPAIQLFVECATASLEEFELTDADAPVVAQICRKLDGIALAIELAAACVGTFGIRELSDLLDNQFWQLRQGRRIAPARQQTLVATLDWSYELLSDSERIVLRRLSVFAGTFTLESASAVGADDGITPSLVIEALANLVSKSLVTADISGEVVQYRLLETTRIYVSLKLGESHELETMVRRHAEHYRDLLVQAEVELERLSAADWIAVYGRKIDDIRIALHWALSANGDRALGVDLTVLAIPLWVHLSLFEECRACVERVLTDERTERQIDVREKMRLCAALGVALQVTRGPRPKVGAAWTEALQTAEQINDADYQLRALWGLSTFHRARGEHRNALKIAERCRAAADKKGDKAALLAAERLIAAALFHLGDLSDARCLLENYLSRNTLLIPSSHVGGFPYDQQVGALGLQAMILWLQGLPDRAIRMAQTALKEATAKSSGAILGDFVLHAPLPIALHVGNWEAAERLLEVVRASFAIESASLGSAKARCLHGILLIRRADIAGLPLLRSGLDELREAEFLMRYPAYLGVLAEGLHLNGQTEEARKAIEEALGMSEQSGEHWCRPELLRVKGEILQSEGVALADRTAEDNYLCAIEMARRQQALSWELRAATSLAQQWRGEGRAEEAGDFLTAVYSQFSEGFQSGDLTRARELIESCRGA